VAIGKKKSFFSPPLGPHRDGEFMTTLNKGGVTQGVSPGMNYRGKLPAVSEHPVRAGRLYPGKGRKLSKSPDIETLREKMA
jgi:hypothetical protein